ncbi:MAG: BrnA antitoxin family protein [Planctomycetes bacterium]|nr:BrnA antitoxin family protein [Planctomycetota bacterium]
MPSDDKRIDPPPEEFKSLEEAAEFWDTHSITDYEESLKPVQLDVDIRRRYFEIEVDDGTLLGLRVGMSWLSNAEPDVDRLTATCPHNLLTICVPGKFCWANVGGKGWTLGPAQRDSESGRPNYAEAARFIALFVDNARTRAEERFRILGSRHVDLVTVYIRE